MLPAPERPNMIEGDGQRAGATAQDVAYAALAHAPAIMEWRAARCAEGGCVGSRLCLDGAPRPDGQHPPLVCARQAWDRYRQTRNQG